MPSYTLHRTSLSANDDYVFRYEGVDVGRCYLRFMSNNETKWSWTIYIGKQANSIVSGVPVAGFAESLEKAEAQFRRSFDRMIAAGVMKLPRPKK